MTFRLTNFPAYCTGIHRSGWPFAHEHLLEHATEDPEAPLLDDFVDASFGYRHVQEPHAGEWVGIFHHPSSVQSPLPGDRAMHVKRLALDRMFRKSVKGLRGAIVMAPTLEPVVKTWLDVPVLVLKHPSDANVDQWAGVGESVGDVKPRLFQAGFFLRDTRFIFHLEVPTWDKCRSKPYMDWTVTRDAKLKYHHARKAGFPAVAPQEVEELPRQADHDYDELLATSVAVTHIYAAAANNVVVESIARAAPLLVNRLPEVEWYLGSGYPLFYRDHEQAVKYLKDPARVQAAHEYMRDELDRSWLDGAQFAEQCAAFVKQVTR